MFFPPREDANRGANSRAVGGACHHPRRDTSRGYLGRKLPRASSPRRQRVSRRYTTDTLPSRGTGDPNRTLPPFPPSIDRGGITADNGVFIHAPRRRGRKLSGRAISLRQQIAARMGKGGGHMTRFPRIFLRATAREREREHPLPAPLAPSCDRTSARIAWQNKQRRAAEINDTGWPFSAHASPSRALRFAKGHVDFFPRVPTLERVGREESR